MSAEPEGDLRVGDRVIDRNADGAPSPARIVELTETPAGDYFIDAIGETVAHVNPEYAETDFVVGVEFGDEPSGGPVYHYPRARLKVVSEDWEPPTTKTDAQREREAAIEKHPKKFDAFREAVRFLAEDPKRAAAWFGQRYDGIVAPKTRGECAHSRDDSYQPEDPEAIVCWHCNDGSRYPRKFAARDPVAKTSPCRGSQTRDPSRVLRTWVSEEIAPTLADVCAPNREYTGLSWDRTTLTDGTVRRRRSATLRIAYEAAIGGLDDFDEGYNHSRAVAYLRDLGEDTEALLPGGDPYIDGGGSE